MGFIRRRIFKLAVTFCIGWGLLMLYAYTQLYSKVDLFSTIYDRDNGPVEQIAQPIIFKGASLFESSSKHYAVQANVAWNEAVIPVRELPGEMVHVEVSNRTLTSYRALPRVSGSMERNKMNDDYSYCPRKEPFLGPFNYENRTKTPCWLHDGRLRCLPYFYIAGFSKCGTSDLYYKINLHPEAIRSSDKEKHWFDYKRFVESRRYIQNFTDMFETATSQIQTDLNTIGSSKYITGDGTPCYVWGSFNWPCYEGNENLTEPRFTNADIIYRLNPKSKIIIMLREPVSRLHSRMLTWMDDPVHPVYTDSTPERFHTFLEERIRMYQDCFQRWTFRHCAYNGTLYKEAAVRLMEGVYSVYIRDWLKVFPRQQILFVKFEEYAANVAKTLMRVFSFLELAPLPDDEFQKIVDTDRANKGRHYDFGPMLNETRTILQEFYRPFNEELPTLLEDSTFYWDYSVTH